MHGPGEASEQIKVSRVGKHGNRKLQPLCPVVRARALTMNVTGGARADAAAEVLLHDIKSGKRFILPFAPGQLF